MSRILLVSDIHANLPALDAVLRDAETRGRPDRAWSLGDAVGYGPQPNECLQRLQSMGALAIAGNHELASLGQLPVEQFNQYAAAAAEWTSEELTEESRGYIGAMAQKVVEGDFTLVHGSPRDPVWEYMDSAEVAAVNFPFLETLHCVNGHTHVPVVLPALGNELETVHPQSGQVFELTGGRWFVNPGSVGQPRDGDPRASYAILDDTHGTVGFHRIEYPVTETQAFMELAGLPQLLVQRLSYGR